MIYIIQLISTMLAVLVIIKSYADYKRRQEAFVVFLFWTATWLGIVYLAFFPQTVDLLSQRFGNDSTTGFNRMLALSFTFLFFITYRVYIKAERVERKLNRLIKDLAVKEMPKD